MGDFLSISKVTLLRNWKITINILIFQRSQGQVKYTSLRHTQIEWIRNHWALWRSISKVQHATVEPIIIIIIHQYCKAPWRKETKRKKYPNDTSWQHPTPKKTSWVYLEWFRSKELSDQVGKVEPSEWEETFGSWVEMIVLFFHPTEP